MALVIGIVHEASAWAKSERAKCDTIDPLSPLSEGAKFSQETNNFP